MVPSDVEAHGKPPRGLPAALVRVLTSRSDSRWRRQPRSNANFGDAGGVPEMRGVRRQGQKADRMEAELRCGDERGGRGGREAVDRGPRRGRAAIVAQPFARAGREPEVSAASPGATSGLGEAARVDGEGPVGEALISAHAQRQEAPSAARAAGCGRGPAASASGAPEDSIGLVQQQARPMPRQVAGGKSPKRSPIRARRLRVRCIDVSR